MAIIREIPKCPFCGKETHKAIYQDQSNLPPQMVVYGDTFIKWESIDHKCNTEKINLRWKCCGRYICMCGKKEV